MSRVSSLALLLLLPVATLVAQPSAGQQAPVRITTTAVSRVILLRILPGQAAAFNRDMLENIIPIYEAAKAAGIIVNYTVFGKSTSDGEEDWQRGITLTYANWAAIDGLAQRMDAITLRHYGSAERRTQVEQARQSLARTVSAFFTATHSYSR